MLAALDQGEEPNHYRDAVFLSRETPEWIAACTKEYGTLIKTGTWNLVLLPLDHQSRWTFKIKPVLKTRGGEIFKARLVAKGFSQVPGVDYNEAEVFASVIKHDSLRLLLTIITALNFELHQVNVKIAFLYGDHEEELYVQQPGGFIQPRKENHVPPTETAVRPETGIKEMERKVSPLIPDSIWSHSLYDRPMLILLHR
jgi:hypothetical protein